jgi:hypothetical protein
MAPLLFALLIVIGITLVTTLQLTYAWPVGTTEADKDKILSVTSDDQLTVREVSISEDRMYEFFDAYETDSPEYQDVLDCGFVEKYGWEVLQCLERKGHPVR